ncbi:MAG TPA: hypothetical protein VN253_07910 [Kofleriaceae bacterium]|nr:hypothetical protein [Kofleriaceae bacterium]
MRSLLLCFLLAACGDNHNAKDDAPPPADAARDAAIDSGPDPRGPATFMLAGGANALLWDSATSTLYLTDNNADALLTWTGATTGVQQVGTFPAATAGISLGDLVKRADGTILTTSFGFGTQGTLFAMAPDLTSAALTGMTANRRRIGLGQDAAGTLYEAYFVGGGGGTPTGGVATVALNGTAATETEIAGATTGAGFKKLVGLVATANAVFVSDQTDKKIYKIAVPGFAVTTVATVATADLLAIMPNGDLLTGGATDVQRVTQTGTVTTIMTGFEQVRGLAYDPALRRLFVIEHSTTVGVPDKLHVRPLDN